ncbi:MAG: HIT family protein [Cellvibrionales bacterium]|nr:HIT family protein [Cellvibrionales bacterium]
MFTLDNRLESDSAYVCDLTLCQVRLMNDKHYPWIILIPKVGGIREIYELSLSDQQQLMKESSKVSRILSEYTNADKMNVAALGNLVPQLHIHHIARFESDVAWPGPVWGVVNAEPYSQTALSDRVGALAELLSGSM